MPLSSLRFVTVFNFQVHIPSILHGLWHIVKTQYLLTNCLEVKAKKPKKRETSWKYKKGLIHGVTEMTEDEIWGKEKNVIMKDEYVYLRKLDVT